MATYFREDQFVQALENFVLADNVKARLCWRDFRDRKEAVLLVETKVDLDARPECTINEDDGKFDLKVGATDPNLTRRSWTPQNRGPPIGAAEGEGVAHTMYEVLVEGNLEWR